MENLRNLNQNQEKLEIELWRHLRYKSIIQSVSEFHCYNTEFLLKGKSFNVLTFNNVLLKYNCCKSSIFIVIADK